MSDSREMHQERRKREARQDGEERRQGERRGGDRREEARPIDFEDRRKDSRRILAPVPLQDFEWEAPAKPKPQAWKFLASKQAILIGLPALAAVTAVAGIALHEPTKRVRAKAPVEKVRKARAAKVVTQEVEVVRIDSSAIRARRTRDDIVSIAPHIYHRVELEVSETAAGDAGGLSVSASAALEKIEIFVKAGPWDDLSRPARVELLERTFSILRSRYPSTTRLLKLIFDDGRKSLDLKITD